MTEQSVLEVLDFVGQTLSVDDSVIYGTTMDSGRGLILGRITKISDTGKTLATERIGKGSLRRWDKKPITDKPKPSQVIKFENEFVTMKLIKESYQTDQQ